MLKNESSERNYERKYEPDERYQELGTSARVWHVYNDEADKYDTDLVEGMSGSLDVLLIFAALFAGIITAFLSQTAQKLDVDTGGVTIALLNEIIALQRATTQNGVDVSSIPRASSTSTPSTLILWVNGLWFTSLNLSIASALLSVLAKQWFHQYSAFKPGSARERAFTRQFRFDGLEKWHVPLIVGLLPSILHASLGLFLLGLFIYLVDLRPSMAISVGILSISLGIVYLITILIPLVDVQCAYRTPLTDILSNILRYYCNQSVRVRHIYRLFEQLQDSLPGPSE
ncbi:hypothetical protein CYLTODRAFT_354526 [Cylindrobasidium torrendii FP15055 ss-10]|uniref:DUF6535 domain-containing protein n=1 Tax=Cylindrobasidium torrendii FP15055 ss-10 TaxID=1314674 RepID=A0A0D7B9A3_9AGAR|nr:hypothetical protein CYLTODRAFT_354526 [Cylindrobasidium torrendii FP15055 ss-10]